MKGLAIAAMDTASLMQTRGWCCRRQIRPVVDNENLWKIAHAACPYHRRVGPAGRLRVACGALEQVNAKPQMVRTAAELEQVDGLIISGRRVHHVSKIVRARRTFRAFEKFVRTGPTFGTCAGCILLAKRSPIRSRTVSASCNATVERNAYGRQIDSQIVTEEIFPSRGPLEMVFICAPRLTDVAAEWICWRVGMDFPCWCARTISWLRPFILSCPTRNSFI